MSSLYYHIIVKYFHIDDEMQFKNKHHNTLRHLPIKKKNQQNKSTHICGQEENKKNSKQIMINEWMKETLFYEVTLNSSQKRNEMEWTVRALPMYFL